MEKNDEKVYLEAVDAVCMDCIGNENDCQTCMVRMTVDAIRKPLRLYVCSPLSSSTEKGRQMNMKRAKNYMEYAKERYPGATVYAVHTILPLLLDDTIPEERELALKVGQTILAKCDKILVFGDRISEGMSSEIDYAVNHGIEVVDFSYVRM